MANSRKFTNSLGQDFCTVRYAPVLNMLTVTWKGGVTRNSVTLVRESILEMLKEKNTPYMLNDMEDLIVVSSDEFIKWLKEEWDVAAVEHGLRYIADVVREDTIAEVYLEDIENGRASAAGGLIVRSFFNRFDALDWLLERKQMERQ